MRVVWADLHVHTALSPCAEGDMTPSRIAKRSSDAGLDAIGVTDHNSAENCGAVASAAQAAGSAPLCVIPGMEVTTSEEIHILCLFEDLEGALSWQALVYDALPERPNDPAVFGEQLVLDSADNLVRTNERLLAAATAISLEDVVKGVPGFGGIAIPSHVDRPAYSLIGVLGMVPDEIRGKLAAVEISRRLSFEEARRRHPSLGEIGLMTSSDAHWLSEIGAARTGFLLEGPPSFGEISLALRGKGAREVVEWRADRIPR